MNRLFGCLGLAFLLPLLAVAGPPADRMPLAELRARTHIHDIAVDPKDPARIYLATHHGVFLVLLDAPAMRVPNNSNDYMGYTPHPVDPAILYASGHPVGGGNLGFIVS